MILAMDLIFMLNFHGQSMMYFDAKMDWVVSGPKECLGGCLTSNVRLFSLPCNMRLCSC